MRPLLPLTLLLFFAPPSPSLEIRAEQSEPERIAPSDLDAELDRLKAAVADKPKDRNRRFDLVKALIDGDRPRDALTEAKRWREIDAYNLVVVRLLGDIYTTLGRPRQALRTYSAVTELLAEDAEAQRALATVLKQQGDLESAVVRLERAVSLRENDRRLQFELADARMRVGRTEEAMAAFEAIADDPQAPKAVRYPATQRLGQLYAAERRRHLDAGRTEPARAAQEKVDALALKGGTQNDIKVYLSWDTDRTDVDLWVTNPQGEKVFYSDREDSHGAALYDDVTSGYGPESFTAPRASKGEYKIEVNYYATNRSTFTEARGEVTVVVNEGRRDEVVRVFPYKLFKPNQTVHVATVEVDR